MGTLLGKVPTIFILSLSFHKGPNNNNKTQTYNHSSKIKIKAPQSTYFTFDHPNNKIKSQIQLLKLCDSQNISINSNRYSPLATL